MRYIQYYKNCYFHARDIQRYNLSYAFNFRNSFYALAQFFLCELCELLWAVMKQHKWKSNEANDKSLTGATGVLRDELKMCQVCQ